MPDPATGERYTKRSPQKPNFLVAVLLSAVALIVFAIIAVLVIRSSGRHLLAPTHPNPQPHSSLRLPDAGVTAA